MAEPIEIEEVITPEDAKFLEGQIDLMSRENEGLKRKLNICRVNFDKCHKAMLYWLAEQAFATATRKAGEVSG
jgi:hypothetical protein